MAAWLVGGALSPTALAVTPITEQELLERHRPTLRYDSAETTFAQPASREARVIEADRVYGRIADDGGRRYLQYWLFYARNDQGRGIIATGRHEGDWEFVQLRLDDRGGFDEVTFAQHSWAEVCGAEDVEVGAGGPVLYVANGSHASYPRPGVADRPWPDPSDEADGEGRHVRPPVTMITSSKPAWVREPGRWGDSRAGVVPGEQSSPYGPMFQGDGRWQDPAGFVAEVGLECGTTPPGRPWQTAALVGIVVAGVGLFLWRRRRG